MHSEPKAFSKIKKRILDLILIGLSFNSFIPQTSFVSLLLFPVNIIFFKRKIKASYIFLNIAFITSVIYFAYLKPRTIEFEKEIYYSGFHPKWETAANNKLNYYYRIITEYRRSTGVLPDGFNDIQNGRMDFRDMSFVDSIDENNNIFFAKFYYEKIDSNKYNLFGLGQDGLPNTDDDLLPRVLVSDTSSTELIRYEIAKKYRHSNY